MVAEVVVDGCGGVAGLGRDVDSIRVFVHGCCGFCGTKYIHIYTRYIFIYIYPGTYVLRRTSVYEHSYPGNTVLL